MQQRLIHPTMIHCHKYVLNDVMKVPVSVNDMFATEKATGREIILCKKNAVERTEKTSRKTN